MKRTHLISPVRLLAVLALALPLAGCTSLRGGPGLAPDNWQFEGPFNAYVSADEWAYNGNVLELDVISDNQQPGEVLNLEVWPLAGVGIGVVGARAHILPFGAGIGTIFYDPKARGDVASEYELEEK